MMNVYGHEGTRLPELTFYPSSRRLFSVEPEDPYLQLADESGRAFIEYFSYIFLDLLPWST